MSRQILGIAAGIVVFVIALWLLPIGGAIGGAIAGGIGGLVWAVVSGDFSKKKNAEEETIEAEKVEVETIETEVSNEE